ncbi:MAG: hypothetical protein ABSG90_13280 [Dehalococcoidia bacterium]|jgi:hypothetical protein
MFGINSLVFPKVDILAKGPVSALAEIRTSFSLTQANIESSLPQGGPGGGSGASATGFKLPDIMAFFKGPGAQNAPTTKTTETSKVQSPKSVFNYR